MRLMFLSGSFCRWSQMTITSSFRIPMELLPNAMQGISIEEVVTCESKQTWAKALIAISPLKSRHLFPSEFSGNTTVANDEKKCKCMTESARVSCLMQYFFRPSPKLSSYSAPGPANLTPEPAEIGILSCAA